MAKEHIPVPDDIAPLLLFESDRTCCVCRERGKSIQIHHIDEDPSNNIPNNLAVLCLQCHDETQIRGGFSRKLDAKQVTHFRNDWHIRVRARRDLADNIASARQSSQPQQTASTRRNALSQSFKLNYIKTLPAIRKDVYSRSKPKWDSGITPQMRCGNYDVIDVLEQILVTLASWYPPSHFGGLEPHDYMNSMTASRFAWHRAHLEPDGSGTGGTIIRTMAVGCVTNDLENMVVDLVSSLTIHFDDFDDFDFSSWKREWNAARKPQRDDIKKTPANSGTIKRRGTK